MRFLKVFSILGVVFLCFAFPARAGPKPWLFDWGINYYANSDFERPYLEDGKTPHNSQWEFDHWRPEDWIEDRGSAKAVMDGLYAQGIITGQYVDDGVPVLEVGQQFIELSGQEKRRVTAFVDHVFVITRSPDGGMFLINHSGTDKQIGMFTYNGLQLQ